ncbi:hypothetical protein [Isoptericola dokdonensis]|uniref:Uncharacterized protein n=1 Tax=Isoptericola dokdonensis DS-3 TaxID=1300344 RepID=A0A168FDF3_9MICO|nr:hypothetical protein [Isoptericola dokdonensis]ANC31431.1 hypothetical protein I598_1883 [Isoptericola dokdonensis DS-3]
MREAVTWANAERLVRGWLADRTGIPTYTETGDNPPELYLIVARVGGSRLDPHERDIDVEVTVYAGDRSALWGAARAVETAMAALAAAGTKDGYVDDVVEAFGFAIDPAATDRAQRVATATYTLTCRPSR